MSDAAVAILANLQAVATERARRMADPELARRVNGLKAFQQQRFARTYADLLASRRYGAAARFFLEQLYGPVDFARRDVQFARVVPALVRLFPRDVVEAVAVLANLHALTESLDTAMATHAVHARWTPDDYARAWRVTGRRADRETQIASILALAMRLDRLTRSAVLRESLRLMRVPARAAGLEDLQRFLETGFDAFRAMHGAAEFMQTIETRERAFVAAMFPAEPFRDGMSGSDAIALTQFAPAAARYAVPSSDRRDS
jgi:hypothetical protein